MTHSKSQDWTKIEFRFENSDTARAFLAYMSDGGGEYGFLEETNIAFDYHEANGGEFGPIVLVTGEVRGD